MKKTIKEHIHHYLTKHHDNEEKIKNFSEFIEDFFHEVEDEHPDVKSAFYMELDDFTDEVDEEMMKEVIKWLRQKDGTIVGAKWSIEEVEGVVGQYDVKTKIENCGCKFDITKYWLALNYVYAAHYSMNRTINGYIDLAIDEYCNKNVHFEDLVKKIFEKR